MAVQLKNGPSGLFFIYFRFFYHKLMRKSFHPVHDAEIRTIVNNQIALFQHYYYASVSFQRNFC